MNNLKKQFIEFLLTHNALKFGEFTLKSGRISPYFFNLGVFHDGKSLSQLGKFYAQVIQHAHLDYDVLFGPAYKGIPLVASISIALYEQHQHNIPYCFNRKEVKTRGEGGQLIGAPLQNKKVVMVDDVITAGTTVRETIDLLTSVNANLTAIIIALDRQETKKDYGVPVISLITVSDIVDYLSQQTGYESVLKQIEIYRAQHTST